MVTDKKLVPSNSENKIRDILLEYLKDNKNRNEYCNINGYRFDKEVDENTGRVDIKIININDFEEHNAYYIIECKRLDGNKTLNVAYINDGIKRFTTNHYSSYYGVNGMIGFIVRKIDIDKNISKIGNFFNISEANKLYGSSHANLKLYHLMMDFSGNLEFN